MLFSLFAFLITISFLVFIHEFGHFWVARRFGVRIEKFSVGFGKPIIKWHGKRDNTEYSLSWIPLGGYVKMYGETPLDNDNHHDNHRDNNNNQALTAVDLSDDNFSVAKSDAGSFSALPPFKRLLIAFAGPAVNLIFAVLVMWTLFIIGVPALKPTIGSIDNTATLAYSDIRSGDNIIAINESKTPTMGDATLALIDALGREQVLIKTMGTDRTEREATIDLSQYQAGHEMAIEQRVGFRWAIDEVIKQIPAVIQTVGEGTPAETAGIQTYDKILNVNGEPLANWQAFVHLVTASPKQTLTLDIERQGQLKTLSLVVGEHPTKPAVGYVGVSPKIEKGLYEQFRTKKQYGFLTALPKAVEANYLQGQLMLKTLGRLVFGKASIENLGGPISIADYSGRSLSAGYVSYFYFLASISLILAVMNLLPIPVLDGGHILMCLIEMIRGKPLSDNTVNILMRIGGSILLTFMLFTLSVDIWRYIF